MPGTLRFVLCGSADDGKSTLLGRILQDCRQVPADHRRAVELDSQRYGTQGGEADLALLVDGLQDEREQGITIDVAYRVFETPRRRFIVADAPGHEQYTRNMVTGASTADLGVVLADARKGVLPQTARHTRILAMFGISRIVLAVNKMDKVGWDRETFETIAREYSALATGAELAEVLAVPISALTGDNVTRRCAKTPWYADPTLLGHLETVDIRKTSPDEPFRMPVQYVNRPREDFRGYCGTVAAGTVAPGDQVRVMPSRVKTEIESIVVWRGTINRASRGDAITLTVGRDVDVTRGDCFVDAAAPLEVADQFQARIVWMGDEPLAKGRQYVMKLHSCEVDAAVTRIRHKIDVTSGGETAAHTLEMNDLGVVNLATHSPVPFATFAESREFGTFILIDKRTCETVGAGTLAFALMRAANIKWQNFDVTRDVRAEIKAQRARCIWLTGLSASGKSTIANLLEKRLLSEGRHTYVLDGDNLRHGLNRDLGFTEADRVENIRRVAEVARLMVDAGLIVICSFISPVQSERDFARSLFGRSDFLEIFVDAPVAACAARDPKGLYAKAMRGEIRNFTGVSSPYEPPARPDLRLNTEEFSPEECVEMVMRKLA